jgi:DNA-binding CsgD family transcriptional regulator
MLDATLPRFTKEGKERGLYDIVGGLYENEHLRLVLNLPGTRRIPGFSPRLTFRVAGMYPTTVAMNLSVLAAAGLWDESDEPWRRRAVSASLCLPTPPPRPSGALPERRAEMDELKRIAPRTRLLTLLGDRGAGKSRLAIQVANEIEDSFAGRAAFADLGAVAHPAEVPEAIAAALGLVSRSVRQTAELIDRTHLLLVLDNVDGVASALAPVVEELLDHCPCLHVLVTARDALDLAGEHRWYVLQRGQGGHLTPRKLEIARLVADGLADREIAERLSISERTVGAHLGQIRTQLGFRNRAQLAAWVASRS